MSFTPSTLPILAAVGFGGSFIAGCSATKEFIGINTATRPQICMVVAPAGLPPDELSIQLASVVNDVARRHGSIDGYLAIGPSAASFPVLDIGAEAGVGGSVSPTGGKRQRHEAAKEWAMNMLATFHLRISISTEPAAGLDLFGGIAQCVRRLQGATREPTVVVISHGINVTESDNMQLDPSQARTSISRRLDEILPAPFQLRILGIGRVDFESAGGHPSRHVVESVAEGWDIACTELGPRCLNDRPLK